MERINPKGSGTLYKRSDGKWIGQLQVDGRRVSVYDKTKQEARQKLDEIKYQARVNGGLPEQQTLYVLLDRFMATGQDKWKPRTFSDYQKIVSTIRYEFGDLPLAKVTSSRIQSLYLDYRHSRRKALYLHQILHRAFNLAVKWGWTYFNPCDRVERPVYKKNDRVLWTVEQCRYFIRTAVMS